MALKGKWTDYIPDGNVYDRLRNCKSRKSDVPTLLEARWLYYRFNGLDCNGFTMGDALVDVLEILDCNGVYVDLTHEEWAMLTGEPVSTGNGMTIREFINSDLGPDDPVTCDYYIADRDGNDVYSWYGLSIVNSPFIDMTYIDLGFCDESVITFFLDMSTEDIERIMDREINKTLTDEAIEEALAEAIMDTSFGFWDAVMDDEKLWEEA